MALIASMLAATAILYAFSLALAMLPCWAILLLIAATAWPIWRHRQEYALVQRRAILASVTHEASRVRRWLWSGRASRVLHVFTALAWAALLLAFASLLGVWHWVVLAADAAALALLIRPVTAWMGAEVRAEQSGLAARRWPLAWLNLAILGLAFFAVDFFVAGAPDTRGLAWHEVGAGAFNAASASAACSMVGTGVGALAAVDALAWHAAEILIPSLPNQGLKLAAWAVFLLQAGVIALAMTRLLLGVAAMSDRRASQPAAPAESSRVFLVTVVVLQVIWAWMALAMRDFDTASLAARGRQAIAWADPCRSDTTSLAKLQASLDAGLQRVRVEEQRRAGDKAERALDLLFAEAEKNVDAYLDWYFTVLGEYQRLGTLVAGRFAESMREELEHRVFGEGFNARLESASREIGTESQVRLIEAAAQLGAQVKSGVAAAPCLVGRIDRVALGRIDRDVVRASTAAGGGVAVAITAGVLARRAATAATTRAASKRVFQGAASLAGRVVTKRAGATLVAAAGGAAVCGPMAPLCALAAGAVAWITLDKAFIEIDQLRFRDEMRAEILESLRAQKGELANDLRGLHEAAIDQSVSAIQQSVRGIFVPMREGL